MDKPGQIDGWPRDQHRAFTNTVGFSCIGLGALLSIASVVSWLQRVHTPTPEGGFAMTAMAILFSGWSVWMWWMGWVTLTRRRRLRPMPDMTHLLSEDQRRERAEELKQAWLALMPGCCPDPQHTKGAIVTCRECSLHAEETMRKIKQALSADTHADRPRWIDPRITPEPVHTTPPKCEHYNIHHEGSLGWFCDSCGDPIPYSVVEEYLG